MTRAAAVIFDLDGTLADSLGDIAAAMDHTLDRFGCPRRTPADYRCFVGDGVGELVRRSLPADRGELTDAAVAEFRAYYLAHVLDYTRPYPGIGELLDGLVARGVPLAVLSNKLDDTTQIIVSRLFGRWSFADVAGERQGVPRKPDPAGAQAIARRLGVASERCLFVGDSGNDMETACGAKMIPVGVLWGFRDSDELLARGARILIARPVDLLPFVEELPAG